MNFDALEIEITRDCNLACPHCMRYEPDETMDAYRGSSIPTEYIDTLFEKHHVFRMLLLTGGEPLLHPEVISYIVDKIIEKQVLVEHFQIVTNGTIIDEEVVSALNKIYDYINETVYEEPQKDAVTLFISEGFHDNKQTMNDALYFYKERFHGTTDLFNGEEPGEGKNGLKMTYSGRAKTFSAPNVVILPDVIRHKIALDADLRILCMLDLTINGNFVIASSHSFQDSDKPENIICSVYDELFEGIMRWNVNNPLNCEEAGERLLYDFSLHQKNFLGKDITSEQEEDFLYFIETLDDEERRRHITHQCYTFLYPDDVERLQNELAATDKLTEKEKYMNLSYWNKRRYSEKEVDFSNYCTCPKVVSKEASPAVKRGSYKKKETLSDILKTIKEKN